MYAGIYIETRLSNSGQRSLMVVEQIETAKGTIEKLLKKLKPLLLEGFTNKLAKYYDQSSTIGVYVSDASFNTFTNYSAETFFAVVKFSDLLSVRADSLFPSIYIDKMHFSYDETRRVFNGDKTINAICDVEHDFCKSTKSRAETIQLLKQYQPDCAIKWYNTTSSLSRKCRRYSIQKIIDILTQHNISQNTSLI